MATKKPCTVSSRVLLSWVDLVVNLGDAGLIAQHFRQWHGPMGDPQEHRVSFYG